MWLHSYHEERACENDIAIANYEFENFISQYDSCLQQATTLATTVLSISEGWEEDYMYNDLYM